MFCLYTNICPEVLPPRSRDPHSPPAPPRGPPVRNSQSLRSGGRTGPHLTGRFPFLADCNYSITVKPPGSAGDYWRNFAIQINGPRQTCRRCLTIITDTPMPLPPSPPLRLFHALSIRTICLSIFSRAKRRSRKKYPLSDYLSTYSLTTIHILYEPN